MKKHLNIKKVFLSFFLVNLSIIFLFSCKTNSLLSENENILPLEILCPSNIEWKNMTDNNENIIEGFFIMENFIKPLSASWTCIKVYLDTPNLQVISSIPTNSSSIELKHVEQFAKENNTIVAINATPWDNKSNIIIPSGIVKTDGIEYFPPVEKYSALCFNTNPLRAYILENQNVNELNKYSYAYGGFFQTLKDNQIIYFQDTRRSRIGIGINDDNSILYILVVTSLNNIKDSTGLSYKECSLILQKLGAVNAMQFDGGHSTCLTLNSKESKKPLLNRKIPIAIGLKKQENVY